MLRIAITGPESTGKSAMAAWLAQQYQTAWVPEFARDYIGRLTRPYELSDLVEIAEEQARLEDELAPKANHLLFCDTDFFVLKVWAEHAFGFCPAEIAEKLHSRPYNLHLLLDVDLPWQPDPQREHPHLRRHFLEVYQTELKQAGVPWALVSGTGAERYQNAVKAIENHFLEVKKDRSAGAASLSG